MQPNEDKKNLFDVSLTNNIKISFEQSSCPYENYTCKIRDELLKEIKEEPWRTDGIKEESSQPSVDIIDVSETSIQYKVQKRESVKDEPCHSSEEVSDDNATRIEDDALLTAAADTRSARGQRLYDAEEDNEEAVLSKILQSITSKEAKDKVSTKLSCGRVVKQTTRKMRNELKANDVLSNKIKSENPNEVGERHNVDTIYSIDKNFSCDVCAFRTKHKYVLIKHLEKHTSYKPYSCNICSYKCRASGNLKVHMKTHTGEKPYSCKICSYKCRDNGVLKVHMRTHTGEKPYCCNICAHKFSRNSHLTSHIKTHTGEKPLSCNICSYKCSSNSQLIIHIRTHTGEKPYSCNICSYKCRSNGLLTKHIRTHLVEKPYSCNICLYKSSLKSNLKSHLKRHTVENPYSCNICSYKCRSKSHLTRHIRSTHSSVH